MQIKFCGMFDITFLHCTYWKFKCFYIPPLKTFIITKSLISSFSKLPFSKTDLDPLTHSMVDFKISKENLVRIQYMTASYFSPHLYLPVSLQVLI